MTRPDVIWLDLDDTVWDFRGNSRKSLARLYALERLDRWFPTPEAWIDCYERHNHALWDQYNRAEVTKDYLMTERFRRPFAEAGCDAATATEMSRRFDRRYLDMLGQCPGLVPGALELLQQLKSDNYTIGILSNGFVEVQYRKLQSAGIVHLIDCVVLSDEIGINKPARELFDYAARKCGAAAGARHLLVGDNPLTDIAGAVNAGWQAIYFNRDGCGTPLDSILAGEVPEITRLEQVMPLL